MISILSPSDWPTNQNYFESTPLSTFIFVKLVSNCLKTDSRPRPFPPHGFTFVAIGIFSFFHAGTFPEKVIATCSLFWVIQIRNEFYFRWLKNTGIEITKSASFPLVLKFNSWTI